MVGATLFMPLLKKVQNWSELPASEMRGEISFNIQHLLDLQELFGNKPDISTLICSIIMK